jgi:hypothetical protein
LIAQAQYENPPHIYALADTMYRNLTIDNESQVYFELLSSLIVVFVLPGPVGIIVVVALLLIIKCVLYSKKHEPAVLVACLQVNYLHAFKQYRYCEFGAGAGAAT